MAVNFGILDPDAPAKIAGSVYAGQQARQQNELAQQQAQMRQQEMGMRQQEMGMRQQEAATQAEDRRIKLANAERNQQFLNTFAAEMEKGGQKFDRPTLGKMLQFGLQSNQDSLVQLATKGLQALDEQEQFKTEMGQFAPKAAPVAPAAPGAFGAMPEPTNALAPAAAPTAAPANALAAGSYSRPQIEQMLTSPNARVREMGKNLLGALPKPTAPVAPPAMVAEYTFAKTPEGGGYIGSFEKFVRDRAIAARPPGAPRPESAPVAVVDPLTGKPTYVSREKAMGMTPASAMEGLSPKDIQKREAALPQATSAVQGFESKSDKFIQDLQKLRDHPGLASITGIAAGRMPGLTSEGRAAQALYDKVVAKGGFQALQDLRDASKTGGALGNVSNQEGKQLTASFSAIDRRQDAPDVQAAIDQAIADIEGSKTRMREAYDITYSYKSGNAPATPPAVVPSRPGAPAVAAKPGGNLSAAEQAELEQLRQRFRK